MAKRKRLVPGCLAGLLSVCIISGVVLVVTGWWRHAKNVAVMPIRGQSLVNLSRSHPFTPPEGQGVSEERLLAYIEVCCRAKPAADALDRWEEAYEKEHGDRTHDAKIEGAGHAGAFMKEIAAALKEHDMGPTEFRWIGERMRRAEAASREGAPPFDPSLASDVALFERHAERLAACSLSPHSLEIIHGFA